MSDARPRCAIRLDASNVGYFVQIARLPTIPQRVHFGGGRRRLEPYTLLRTAYRNRAESCRSLNIGMSDRGIDLRQNVWQRFTGSEA